MTRFGLQLPSFSGDAAAELFEHVAGRDPAGFTVGHPHEVPDLIKGHIEAGADEVIFSLPFADAAAIGAVAEALSLR